MDYPNADPVFDETFEDAEEMAARLGYISTWLERVERTMPVQPGNEMALRNLRRIQEIIRGWKEQAIAMEVRLRIPED